MQISAILTATKAIVSDPKRWTQHFHAVDAEGESVRINDPKATCFCLDAALAVSAGVVVNGDGDWTDTGDYESAKEHLHEVTDELTQQRSYVRVNDGIILIGDRTEYEGTLFLLDTAIDRAITTEVRARVLSEGAAS